MPQGSPPAEARRRVLIVDDVPVNVQMLASALGREYDLFFATSGERALDLFGERQPDLVLLDVMMPGMDGFEVCRRLKATPRGARVPVIFVTALGEVEDEARGFEAGGVDYITKPISVPVVRARVRTHLELHVAREGLQRQNEVLAENLELKEQVDRISRHDLRTPLTGILGAAGLLMEDEALTDDHRELVRVIERSGYRLLNMINLSLGLFHMEKGTYQLQPVAIDLRELAARVAQDLRRQATGKGVRIELRRADGAEPNAPLPAIGEEVLTYAALGNLTKNAVEAAPSGSVVAMELESSEGEAVLRIHNEGAVPEEIRPTFFEKYSSAGKVGGSGLGTYSARLMVETQQGRIAMRTSDAEGTTLEVRLPVKPAAAS